MITTLREKGITNEAVLAVMGSVPRHEYMPDADVTRAYQDLAYDIGVEQTISRPHTVATQSTLLDIKKGDLILEIGTGSGYQATILHLLGGKVYTIERQAALFEKTTALLERLGLGLIRTYHGDGYKGLPRFAPFDKIILTCGAKEIPKALLGQLKVGGTMVVPYGDEQNVNTMLRIVKLSVDQFKTTSHGTFSFVSFKDGKSFKKTTTRRTKRHFDPSLKRVTLD
jgi:protein-L-isoaspartate(D-aspartate) O-methyltransferase